MAIAAILFSLWYGEIAKALEIKPKPHSADNVAARKSVTAIILSKALPVAIMSLAVAGIFFPDAYKLARESMKAYEAMGFAALNQYDAVKTAYCFVTVLSIVLAIYMWVLVADLWALRRKLS
jgi:hypothetical protein